MADRFIGIENEFTSFKDGESGFIEYFNAFTREGDFRKTDTCVRTTTGHGFYMDGHELELVTPPVALNKGFSTRLTDLLLIGRDRIAKKKLGMKHTGFSMHWNLSRHSYDEKDLNNFLEGIAIPFHLFGLTPVSVGLALRDKEAPYRYEILGDHISSEDQLKATALLLGAYAFSFEKAGRTSLIPMGKRLNIDYALPNYLCQGRQTPILTYIHGAHFKGEISAQQYLELFYHWIEPFVKVLGSKNEIANLEEHIHGTKKLEFDLKEYYDNIKANEWIHYGVYNPKCPAYDTTFTGPVLTPTGKRRKLPLEGKLLGAIVKKERKFIIRFEWGYLRLLGQRAVGTTEIFEYASTLDENLPPFRHSLSSEEIEPNSLPPYAAEQGFTPNVEEGSVDRIGRKRGHWTYLKKK